MRKYKLFNKIPVFDVALVLVILCAAIFVLKTFTGDNGAKTVVENDLKTIRYTIEFQNVSAEVVATPIEGQRVRDVLTNADMGTVVSYESYPFSQIEMNTLTGEAVENVYKDRQCVKVVVEAVASVSNKSTTINNVSIGLGRNYKFSLPTITGYAIVRNIEEVAI